MEYSNLNPLAIGADIGQIRDNTAICVTEMFQKDTGKIRQTGKPTLGRHDGRGNWIPPKGIDPVLRTEYTVRDIKRLPLGTSYPDVADYLADLLPHELFANRNVRVLLDSTGVGKPVFDMLKAEIALRPQCKHIQLRPIMFVYGERYNRSKGTLGKAFLVSRLQSLLQSKRVHGPETHEMKVTIDELLSYEIKLSDNGTDVYGGKTGTHDDLATALAISTLEDAFSDRVSHSERIY